MSPENLFGDASYADRVRRWLVTPDTVGTWLVSTALWMSVAFAVSLRVGSAAGLPKAGMSLGILLSGLCLVYTVDRMWRQLDGIA